MARRPAEDLLVGIDVNTETLYDPLRYSCGQIERASPLAGTLTPGRFVLVERPAR
jgi:hypothetical protein